MARKGPGPKKIALWRFEVIEAALDPSLTRRQRAKLLRRISRTPLRWPSGEDRRPALATLYRWLKAYRERNLEGLKPRPRRDKGRSKVQLSDEIVRAAIGYLQNDPEQSWTFLCKLLEIDFQGRRIARSTVYRRVTAQPDYAVIKRSASKKGRRRRRFVAATIHLRWQCDAKGPFEVRLVSGATIKVHVITILEDASRAVLASHVVASPNLGACVGLFRRAVEIWGLPKQYYADRASIFDAISFRAGLAELGVTRIWTKPRYGPAHGKIEAFHRVLELWFVKRLKAQQVVDQQHLSQLLDGMIFVLYQAHIHRGLKKAPEELLGKTVSPRRVTRTQLHQAFLDEKHKKTNPTSGEVELQSATWIVPDALRGKRCLFLLDPAQEWDPVVVTPVSKERLPLRRAEITKEDVVAKKAPKKRWGEGPLQKLYDSWAGQVRPVAEPGFGLPEFHVLLGQAVGRHVPQSQREASLVQHFYRTHGPLPRQASEKAFAALRREHAPGHALTVYLDAFRARIVINPDSDRRKT